MQPLQHWNREEHGYGIHEKIECCGRLLKMDRIVAVRLEASHHWPAENEDRDHGRNPVNRIETDSAVS